MGTKGGQEQNVTVQLLSAPWDDEDDEAHGCVHGCPTGTKGWKQPTSPTPDDDEELGMAVGMAVSQCMAV